MNRKFPSILVSGKNISKESQFNDLFFVYHKKSVKNTRRVCFNLNEAYLSISLTSFFLSFLIFVDISIQKIGKYRFGITECVLILMMNLYINRFNLKKSTEENSPKKIIRKIRAFSELRSVNGCKGCYNSNGLWRLPPTFHRAVVDGDVRRRREVRSNRAVRLCISASVVCSGTNQESQYSRKEIMS